MVVALVVWWLAFAGCVGWFARAKGLDGPRHVLLSLLISPVLAGLVVVLRRPHPERLREPDLSGGDSRQCPRCAEWVRVDAGTCGFCRGTLPVGPARAARPSPARRPQLVLAGAILFLLLATLAGATLV